ncbi:MAG: hypothetical protein ACRD2Z_09680 [Thermoanaerobaculia bacterium]
MTTEAEKQKRRTEARRAYWAFLDGRIPELRRSGYPGRTAREQADREWGERKK